MLNTFTGINCIQSVFPHCKLQQSEAVTKKTTKEKKKTKKKRLLTLNNIETNEINKKQSKMNLTHICYTDQSFKCEYSSNFNFIFSFQYREIYVAVFTIPFAWSNSNFSCLCC